MTVEFAADVARYNVKDEIELFQYPVPGIPFIPDLKARCNAEFCKLDLSWRGIGPSGAIAPVKGPNTKASEELDRKRTFVFKVTVSIFDNPAELIF